MNTGRPGGSPRNMARVLGSEIDARPENEERESPFRMIERAGQPASVVQVRDLCPGVESAT